MKVRIKKVTSMYSDEEQLSPDSDALFAAILNRRSMGLSRLKPDAVDRRLIERMLEAATWAPSHGETEPWRFTVFSGEGRERLAELFDAAMREDNATNPAVVEHVAGAQAGWLASHVGGGRGYGGRVRRAEFASDGLYIGSCRDVELKGSFCPSSSGAGAWTGSPCTPSWLFYLRLALDGMA